MKRIKYLFNPSEYVLNKANLFSERKLEQLKLIPISKTESQDVFIAGFPKSGNTWMQNLLSGVLFGISTELLPDRLTQDLVPDVHYKKYYKRFLDFNCFKTHNLPKKNYKRVIYLVRDPRDVIVSYYHFLKNLGKDVDFKNMIISENGELSQWKAHVNKWKENPYNSEIMILKYEDLLINSMREMKRVTKFINIERSDEVLFRAIDGNTFEKMRKKEDTMGFDNDVSRDTWKSYSNFFRKGKRGSHKEELTKELIELIEIRAFEEMEYLNYD